MNRVIFSSLSDHWPTPEHVKNGLIEEFDLNFDPCPLRSDFDGAKAEWGERVFLNPPYSKIGDFLRHGLYMLAEGRCELLVCLLPARTDTKWFHDYCLKADEIRFIKGRLKFGGAKHNAPFPSVIVIFRSWQLDKLPVAA
jgi:hypothetical protein